MLDLDWDTPTEQPTSPIMEQQQSASLSDLLSIGNSEAQASSPSMNNNNGNFDDIMNLFNNSPTNPGVQTFTPPVPQQQQQQVAMNDFTNDFFGSSPIQQQQPNNPTSTTKDPFADLF